MAVDWDGILSEASKSVMHGNFSEKDSDLRSDVVDVAAMAASIFINGALIKSIESSGVLSAADKEALSKWDYEEPERTDALTATVKVIFKGDPHRDSLYDEYDGIEDIVALLNDGYSASGQVYGEWHGERIPSRDSFGGAHFIEDAIRTEMSRGAQGDYTIISIERSE